MTQKIIEYRTCSTPNIAQRFIEYFEKKHHTHYDWGLSLGEVEDAVAVCVLEVDSGRVYVTTTKNMNYINNREVVKEIDIGGL